MTTVAESNTDFQKLARFLSEIRKCDDELDTLKGEHMARCKAVRERKSAWMTQIGDAGFDVAAVKFNLKADKLEAAVRRHREGAEEDTVETADAIKARLGEFAGLPLGAAAVEHAETEEGKKAASKPRKGRGARPDMSAASKADALNVGDEDEPDLRSRAQIEREAARVAEAEERLAGIKPLDGQAIN